MKEKIQFEDQKIDSLVNILRSIALGKSDFDDGEIIKRTVTSLNNYADLIIADTDKLPISDEQASILKNTIKEVVPIIRRSYLTIKERCNKADKNKALATEFAMNFWECHNYRACVNLLGIFNDYQVYKYADTKYLKISGIGVRGAFSSRFSSSSARFFSFISAISLRNFSSKRLNSVPCVLRISTTPSAFTATFKRLVIRSSMIFRVIFLFDVRRTNSVRTASKYASSNFSSGESRLRPSAEGDSSMTTPLNEAS